MDLNPQLHQVVGQVLGHALGEGGDQHPLPPLHSLVDLPHQVLDLALGRPDDHLWVHQARGADDLLHHLS